MSETRALRGDVEITNFGYWFGSAKFDTGWSMRNLLEVLRVRGKVEPDHVVAERLVKVSQEMPAEAVQALGFLIEGDNEGWSIYGWQEHARSILEVALAKDTQARDDALRVINLLGARGHHVYRDLMNRQ